MTTDRTALPQYMTGLASSANSSAMSSSNTLTVSVEVVEKGDQGMNEHDMPTPKPTPSTDECLPELAYHPPRPLSLSQQEDAHQHDESRQRTKTLSRISTTTKDVEDVMQAGLHELVGDKDEEKGTVVVDVGDEVTYPDGGLRAWSVALGGWMISVCAFGIISSWGAYQTYYYNNTLHDYSESAISSLGSVASGISFFLAAFGGILFDKFGARKLLLGGSCIMVLAYLLLSFCKEYWQIFLCQTLMVGIGMSPAIICPVAVVNQWFHKKKGLAVGIVMSGASAGAVGWPLIINHLPSKIGFAWTIRLIALMLAFLLFGGTILLRTRFPPKPSGPIFLLRAFLENKPYLFCALSCWTFSFGFFFFMFYIGQYALEHGLKDKGVLLLITANAGSGLGRVLSGYIADKTGKFNCMVLGAFVASVTIFAWQAATTFPGLIVVSLIYGISTGGNISLQPVCVAQVTKDQRLAGTMIGQTFALQATAVLMGPPISGAILGKTSASFLANFKYCVIFNGMLLMLSAVFGMIAKLQQNRRVLAKI